MSKEYQLTFAVAIFTKNEETNIEECVASVLSLGDVYVIDSQSNDATCDLATSLGATVLQFHWDGKYPRKKQWTLDQLKSYSRVLMFDADLRATPQFIQEIKERFTAEIVAASCPIEYHFMGKQMRYGLKVRYLGILDPNACKYPDVEPESQGYGDIEFHYQPVCSGKIVKLKNPVLHKDNDTLDSWVERHHAYSKYQAALNNNKSLNNRLNTHKTLLGRLFARAPFKGTLRFTVSYFLLFGFLDGIKGFRYNLLLAQHHYLSYLYKEELGSSDGVTK